MKVCIHTFGCQMNKLDSELVAETLNVGGHTLVADEDEADVILFNTCSVRDNAEQRVTQRVLQLKKRKKENPNLIIGLMGCFAQREGKKLFERLKHLDLVCGTRQFPHINELIERAKQEPTVSCDEDSLTAPGALDPHERSLHNGMHGYVSVMRGCNNFCTYCIVPYVRGREESRPPEAIAEEVAALSARGVKEITLLGQNVDAYGKDIGSSFSNLLRAVHEVDGIKRIRFATSHPRDINRELISTMAELPRVADHLHMPAQSGSNRILEAMHRGYTREEYDEKIEMIHELAPNTLVTSDFIVGFPGETEEDFKLTLELLEKSNFLNAYIFKYSPRPGTVSAKEMDDDVLVVDKKRRNQELLKAQEKLSLARKESLVGTTQEVLVEGISQRNKERYTGRTSGNLICVFDKIGDEDLAGELVKLKIVSCSPLTMLGERV